MRALSILFLVFTLAACGGKSTESDSQDVAADTVSTEIPTPTKVAEKPDIT